MTSLDMAMTRNADSSLVEVSLTDGNCQRMISWFHKLHIQPRRWSARYQQVLSLLVEFGLDSDIRQSSESHAPLIVCVVDNGDITFVKKLVAHKAKFGASDDSSDTALIRAAKNKDRAVCDALKAAGANNRIFFWTIWTNYAPG